MANEIILYQPNETVKLEVRLENETVWLTQAQMAELFEKDQSVIARHIANVFKEGEVDKASNMQILHNTLSRFKPVGVYSLNVIISVGYRVKSLRGTQFRIWATKILHEYLLRGRVNGPQRIQELENRMSRIETRVENVEVVVKTALPPREGLFFAGQVYDAFKFVREIITSAKSEIILIDNYIDDSVLTMKYLPQISQMSQIF